MPAEIQTYFDKMETLMNDCQKHVEAMELDKAKEKNQEISNVLTEVIEWSSNNGHKDKIPALEKLKNEINRPFLFVMPPNKHTIASINFPKGLLDYSTTNSKNE